jgi:hypoxanthine phosphoribosyltransferase
MSEERERMKQPQIQILYDAATIQKKVAALGQKLQADHADSDPLLISIVGGSVVFLADLLRAIQNPIRYETVQVHYSVSGREDGVLEIHFPISLNVKDQELVVIKDVIASGVIETYLTSQFLQLGAKQVRFVALIDLPEERKSDFTADYGLFTPKKTGKFIGYGLKVNGRYGSLPYLGRIVDESERNFITAPDG